MDLTRGRHVLEMGRKFPPSLSFQRVSRFFFQNVILFATIVHSEYDISMG